MSTFYNILERVQKDLKKQDTNMVKYVSHEKGYCFIPGLRDPACSDKTQ